MPGTPDTVEIIKFHKKHCLSNTIPYKTISNGVARIQIDKYHMHLLTNIPPSVKFIVINDYPDSGTSLMSYSHREANMLIRIPDALIPRGYILPNQFARMNKKDIDEKIQKFLLNKLPLGCKIVNEFNELIC